MLNSVFFFLNKIAIAFGFFFQTYKIYCVIFVFFFHLLLMPSYSLQWNEALSICKCFSAHCGMNMRTLFSLRLRSGIRVQPEIALEYERSAHFLFTNIYIEEKSERKKKKYCWLSASIHNSIVFEFYIQQEHLKFFFRSQFAY